MWPSARVAQVSPRPLLPRRSGRSVLGLATGCLTPTCFRSCAAPAPSGQTGVLTAAPHTRRRPPCPRPGPPALSSGLSSFGFQLFPREPRASSLPSPVPYSHAASGMVSPYLWGNTAQATVPMGSPWGILSHGVVVRLFLFQDRV